MAAVGEGPVDEPRAGEQLHRAGVLERLAGLGVPEPDQVAHTEQQREAPVTGPLVVSQPGDALEREADSIARGALG